MLRSLRFLGFAVVVLFTSIAAVPADEFKPNFFKSSGVKLCYYDVGEGEPVVLLHGFTINSQVNWELSGIVPKLRNDFRVVALDVRGHGGSEKPHDPNKYGAEMIEDVVRLLDHLRIQRAHIVGYSMGGFITNRLLATHPDRLITATLGGAGWGRVEDKPPFLDDLAESLEKGKGISPLLIALTPPGQRPPSEEQLKFANQMLLLTNDQRALAALIRGMPAFAIPRESLEKNKLPVLALIGDRDPFKAGVDAMNGVMPHLKVVVIPGADHMQTFYSPLFVKSLHDFLSAHRLQPVSIRTN